MPMVDIRHVLMLVFDGVVDMGMAMRERKVIRIRMMPVMMSVVMRMPMLVNDGVVPMEMVVLLGHEKYRADDHDGQGRQKCGVGRFPKQDDGQDDSCDRGRAEQGAGPPGAETAHRVDEQDNAQPVAHAPQEHGPKNRIETGQRVAEQESRSQGDQTGAESFDGDDHQGVLRRDVPREIVVHSPEQTRDQDPQGAEGKPPCAAEIR